MFSAYYLNEDGILGIETFHFSLSRDVTETRNNKF